MLTSIFVIKSVMLISDLITNMIDSTPFSIASRAFLLASEEMNASICCAIFQLLVGIFAVF